MRSPRRFALLCAPLALSAACDDTDYRPSGPKFEVSVTPIPTLDGLFFFDLGFRTLSASGEEVMSKTGLSSQLYGFDGAITYIGVCAPGEGHIELGVENVQFNDPDPQAGHLVEANVSLDIECAAGTDTQLAYDFELATLNERGPISLVEFSDVTCTVARTCKASGIGADVTCSRSVDDGLGVALGLIDSRIVCGTLGVPVAPIGENTPAPDLASIKTSAESGLAIQRWSIQATPPSNSPDGSLSSRQDCHLEARFIAAPELSGGRPPACTAWPVVELSVPLSVEDCANTSPVSVDYIDASQGAAALVIDARGPHIPASTVASSCTVTSTGTVADPNATSYFDLSVQVFIPGSR